MPGPRRRRRPRMAWMDNIKTWTGLPVEESTRMREDREMEKVRTSCGQPSDRGRLKNRTEQIHFVHTDTEYVTSASQWIDHSTYVHPHYLVISKLEKRCCRVGSRRQDKDQRRHTTAVVEGAQQIKWRRLHKLFPDFLRHEFYNRRDNFVRAYCSQYEQPLELAKMFLKLFRQLRMMRFLRSITALLNGRI